jgi:hypothetical protein
MGRKGTRTGLWWESQNKRDHKEDLVVGGRIILSRFSDLRVTYRRVLHWIY